MENTLKTLFEYNRFENNTRLSSLIEETEAHYDSELSENDLSLVSAAGSADTLLNKSAHNIF